MDWYPWYFRAYQSKTLHLNLEQDAIYRRLIDWYMDNRLHLPSNSQALARICQISLDKWQEHEAVIREFFVEKGGKLMHERCDIELDRQDTLSSKRSRSAKEAADKRKASKENPYTSKTSEQVPSKCSANAPIHDMTEQDRRKEYTSDFEKWWAFYPKKDGKRDAAKAFSAALKKTDLGTLTTGAQSYALNVSGSLPKHIKNAQGWLNGERWNDQPSASTVPLTEGGVPKYHLRGP